MNNRLHNIRNPYQGDAKRVLCVCSAGLLRSPTAAKVLAQEPYNYNTRACGITKEYALIPFDHVLYTWADEVYVMEQWMKDEILEKHMSAFDKIKVLGIEDNYAYNDPELVQLIKDKVDKFNYEKDIEELLVE